MMHTFKTRFKEVLTVSHTPLSHKAFWICCTSKQSNWIITEGIDLYKPKSNKLEVILDEGGARFLFDFLKILRPELPFDRIVEADLEFLIEELNPIFYPASYKMRYPDRFQDYYDFHEIYDKRDKWFTRKYENGYIFIYLENKSNPRNTIVRNTLAAIRLASFCSLGIPLIVIDKLNAIDSFDNNYEDPSGGANYIFEILRF